MKDELLYLDDIVERIERIESYLKGEPDLFFTNLIVQDAVLQNLIVIGEAASKVGSETRAFAPAIPWRNIVGMRNHLVHGYTGINIELTWQVVQNDLPSLKEEVLALRKLLAG